MKRYYILFILFSFGFLSGQAQESVCLSDTITIQTDSFRGDHSWQTSINGTDWTVLEGISDKVLELIPQHSLFYRYEVIEGTCVPYYSDIIEIIVNMPPEVTLTNIDSVCQNLDVFQLSTGVPTGGVYTGEGIIDGRFIAAMTEPGTYQYSYSFQDTSTTCVDTAFAIIEVLPLPSAAMAGDDFLEIIEDSIMLDATAPMEGKGIWTIVSGGEGYFSDITNPQSWFKKNVDSIKYTLKWTVSNTCGTYSDDADLIFLRLSANPCPGTPVVYDADGNMYPTVQIGEQCWMAENLKIGTTVTSTVDTKAHSDASNNGIIERYTMDNEESNIALYGGLYDWDEMMGYIETEGNQGICPEGWHIPTVGEYDDLDNFYKKVDTGDHLKEGGDSGFEGKLVGDRHNQGTFVSQNSSGFFWTSSSYTYNGANDGWVRELCACNSALDRIHFSKKTGASVRCIKD